MDNYTCMMISESPSFFFFFFFGSPGTHAPNVYQTLSPPQFKGPGYDKARVEHINTQ